MNPKYQQRVEPSHTGTTVPHRSQQQSQRKMPYLITAVLLLAGIFFLGFSRTASAQNVPFIAGASYPVGNQPLGMVQADFNGDGFIDVAVVNMAGNNVAVLMGTSSGSFQPAVSYAAGLSPVSLAVADVDGNGTLDLVVVNSLTLGTVSILMGNGDGTFGLLATYGVGELPFGVAIGDLNGDGLPDLVVANPGSNTVSVLVGVPGGRFAAAGTVSVPLPFFVALKDLNFDGKLDLVITQYGTTASVSVALGNGNATFGVLSTYAVGTYPGVPTVVDLNGDGKPDIAVPNAGDSNLSVLLGNGDGSFGAAKNYPTQSFPNALAAGDFNGDGIVDLAVVETSTVSILPGNGDGSFSPAPNHYLAGLRSSFLVAADFDRDGHLDVAVSDQSGNTVAVLRGNGDGTLLGAPAPLSSGANTKALVVADFNNDGFADFIPVDPLAQSTFLSSGNGTFQVLPPVSLTNTLATATVADFNHDGKMDLVIGDSVTWHVFTGNGDGTFGFYKQGPPFFGISNLGLLVGDFNEDGVSDILALDAGDNTLYPSPLYPQDQLPHGLIPNYGPGVSADFNADGHLDYANGEGQLVTVNFGDGSSCVCSSPAQVQVGNGYAGMAVGDFNHDGILDFVTANSTDNNVSVVMGRGNLNFATAVNYGVGKLPNQVVVADFDNDGNLDVAAANLGDGTVSILMGNGDGTFRAAVNLFVRHSSFLAAGKFTGTATDLVAADATGAVVLFNTKGTHITAGSSLNPSTFAQPISLSVTLAANLGSTIPTGSVSFYDGATLLGTANLSGGAGGISTSSLGAGVHTIKIIYSGDANFVSAQTSFTQSVLQAATSLALSSSVNPVPPTLPVTFTATVIPSTSGTPTGNLTFLDGAAPLGSVPLNNAGQASLTTSTLALGNHSITAQYGGDINYLASGSVPLIEAVSGGVATLSAISLNFGTIGIKQTSAPEIVTLTNTGNAALAVNSISSNSVEFIATNTCPASLAAGASCSITINFRPKAVGTRNSTVTISNSYATGQQVISVTGVGVNSIVSFSTTNVVFSAVLLGNSSALKSVKMTNTSTMQTLTINSIVYSGDYAAASVSNPCPGSGTLAPGKTCNLGAIFKPTATGTRPGGITIVDSDATAQQIVGLTGIGSGLKISPAALVFPIQTVGTTSASKSVLLSNVGGSAISLTSVTASSEFGLATNSNCGSSIPAGAFCSLFVTFTPGATGTRSGSITVASSDPASPSTIKLSGTGTIVGLTPGTVAFASQGVGTTSTSQTVILTNVGNVPVNISSISVTGTNPADFLVQSAGTTCQAGIPVPPLSGNTCSIAVAFAPKASGSRNATLTISDDGGGGLQTVALTGTGVVTLVSITVAPASPTIAAGSTQQFTATGNYSDGSSKDLTTSATWSSSDVTVATISNSPGTQGLALAGSAGTTSIVATSGSVSGLTNLAVTP